MDILLALLGYAGLTFAVDYAAVAPAPYRRLGENGYAYLLLAYPFVLLGVATWFAWKLRRGASGGGRLDRTDAIWTIMTAVVFVAITVTVVQLMDPAGIVRLADSPRADFDYGSSAFRKLPFPIAVVGVGTTGRPPEIHVYFQRGGAAEAERRRAIVECAAARGIVPLSD